MCSEIKVIHVSFFKVKHKEWNWLMWYWKEWRSSVKVLVFWNDNFLKAHFLENIKVFWMFLKTFDILKIFSKESWFFWPLKVCEFLELIYFQTVFKCLWKVKIFQNLFVFQNPRLASSADLFFIILMYGKAFFLSIVKINLFVENCTTIFSYSQNIISWTWRRVLSVPHYTRFSWIFFDVPKFFHLKYLI